MRETVGGRLRARASRRVERILNAPLARRPVLVHLDDERLALLDERAARSGQSRSALIRVAVDEYLDADAHARIDADVVTGYGSRPLEVDRWAEVAARETIAAEPW